MKKIIKMIVIITSFLLVVVGNLECTYAVENVQNMNIKISSQTSTGGGGPSKTESTDKTSSSTEDNAEDSEDSISSNLGDLDAYHSNATSSGKLKSRLGTVLGWIRAIGIILSVVILSMIGVKYMLTSVEGKAEYKKSMVPYIWGAAIVFLGSYVPQLIYDIVKEIEG